MQRDDDERRSLKLSEVAREVHVSSTTIRSWERRYGWPRPFRTLGGHRRYTADDLDQLRMLRAEIAKGRSVRRAIALLERARSQRFAAVVDGLVDAALGLDTHALRRELARVDDAATPEDAVERALLPALRAVGLRWAHGSCDVASEHLLTTEVRSWLETHVARARGGDARESVVLAAAPGELHTVGLEAFALLVARAGRDVVVLGASTPQASLARAVAALRPCAVVVTSQQPATRAAASAAVAAIDALRIAPAFFAGDGFATSAARRGVRGAYLGDDLVAARARLAP
ncbi:MAG TPA: MerR family transcriptional regulator [Actinomycetota bacterium]|nr:MerR family transcriptional regulator [Actinomycetota bacterium]